MMEKVYEDTAKQIKAISEAKRLRIIDMLSCGEMCACKILEAFKITQPTLSHDMKVLVDAGLVFSRREGKNIYYSLNEKNLQKMYGMVGKIIITKEDCICKKGI
jgi:ArsR family transcriptional regulator